MKYFERKRRSLFKNHYVNGAQKSVSGSGSIPIISSAGVPFKSLEISGVSRLVPETDIMPNYIEYFKNIESYEFGSVSSVYEIPFPTEWLGKELSFSLVEKTKMKDITFGLSNGGGFFANSINLLGYNGELSSVKSSEFSHFRFTGIVDSDTFSEITNFWQNYVVKVIKDAEGESPTPSEPWTLKCLGDEGVTVALGEKTVKIPKSVTVNNEKIPLMFSEYDKLIVDGERKRVIYRQGSLYKEFENGNQIATHNWASQNGYGNNYIYQKWYHNTEILNNGYCNYFPLVPMNWDTMSKQENVFALYSADDYIAFRTNGTMTLTEFKNWIAEKYNEGTPLTLLVKRVDAIEHDLTDTNFGKELLLLTLEADKSDRLSVSGNLGGAPISAVYYSTKEADTVNITVKYIDESGNEIKEPWINQTRKGSKYLIVAPHIDGYARVTNEVYGVADNDSEIILEYRR